MSPELAAETGVEARISYRTYWAIWGVLLVLTLMMLAVEAAEMTRVMAVLLLLGAMAMKASLITGWFMHLKYEQKALAVTVVVATVLTVAFLFGLIAPDGMAALRQAP